MFDIYNTDTYNEVPDAQLIINDIKVKNHNGFLTIKEIVAMILELEEYLKYKKPNIQNLNYKISKEKISEFLYNLYLSSSTSQLQNLNKKDWISEDIKAMIDIEGKLLSRKRQGKIQVIRDSEFLLIKQFPEETRKKIKDIFINCLRKREPKYRIRQEIFDNFASLNWDCYDFVDYELSNAETIAYIKDEIYNTNPGEKVYFKRFEEIGCCSKCKKLNGKIALWSDVPLDSNKTNDEYADYVIWDDRFTEKKSKIPLTWCCKSCRGSWIRYYPEV
ncbi:hypothetical protein II906_10085 [bacterium]|nr:hypothetical protein [bacterium]